ncbi:MAG: efflux RND transporter periplasmic adaptor subunit [Bacteroidota bacterium]|nr:efflux RND transporter periplasmic adaptor subunit [Bacteroidota bacterium]
MKKYYKFIIAAIVLLIFIGTFVFLWMKSRPQPVAYEEFTPKVMDLSKSTVVTGKIEPRNEVNVKPQISGIITEIYKESGQMVNQGEVIAKVKVIPDMGQLSAAQARVRSASINVGQAKVDYDRVKALYDKGLISGDEFDQKRKAYHQAQEEVRASNDNLEVVRNGVSSQNAQTSSTLVRSTISGLILDVPVKIGNTVILANTFNDGTTIATIANMGDLIFRGNVDETEVGNIVQGMPMKITIGALQDEKLMASLEYISPKAVENNGANQFEIKAAIHTGVNSRIRSGYSANAEIVLAEAKQVLTLPESAIEFSGSDTYIYIVSGSGESKTYTKRKVVTGLSDGINIEIKSGLKKSDLVRGPKIVKEPTEEK